jgi:hypothetical protein
MPPVMRGSNQRARGTLVLASLFVLSAILAACGGTPPASVAPPTAQPTPVITPDPHLAEPVTADQIFTAIRVAKLPLSVNNATAGLPGAPIIKQINAQVANWPLVITQYRSSQVLRDALKWNPTVGPKQGDPPYAWVAMNILISFGPVTGKPTAPDADRQKQAQTLIALVDPLLWPIEQKSMAPVPTKTAPPPASPPPSAAPSVAPPSKAP